jgi:hypothetical protein
MFLVCELGNVAGKVFEDGKVTIGDAAHLLALTDELKAITSVEWPKVPSELKDAFAPEAYAATVAELVKKFDIPQDQLEARIEGSLSAVGHVIQGISQLVNTWKR